jgi:hypothetical protein
MSSKHVKAAIASGLFKGNALVMLLVLAHKAGTGKPFANGKTIPEGEVRRCTDKVLMRALRIKKRYESIRQIRKRLFASGVLSGERQPNFYDGRSTYPAYVYWINLDRLEAAQKLRRESTPRRLGGNSRNLPLEKGGANTNSPHGKRWIIGDSVPASASGSIPESVISPVGEGGDGASQRGSSSAAQPPHLRHHPAFREQVIKHFPETNGWDSWKPEILERLYLILEQERVGWSQRDSLFRFAARADWIRIKTHGRTDWLVDRFESPGNGNGVRRDPTTGQTWGSLIDQWRDAISPITEEDIESDPRPIRMTDVGPDD